MTETPQHPHLLARAKAIVANVRDLEREVGRPAPGPGRSMARLVQTPLFEAKVIRDYRWTIGRVYEDVVGQRLLSAAGWILIELQVQGRLVLVANLKGKDVSLHLYKPGAWETWFGFEEASEGPGMDPLRFPRPGTPGWERIVTSADYKLAPERTGPARGEAHRAKFFKPGRKRWKLAYS